MTDIMTVRLTDFEGPMDLLLFLIKRNNLEISRISLAQITDQYLTYLESLKVLDVDIASEFLSMAAELTHIKSMSLLPKIPDPFADEEEGTIGNDLVAKLLEFERYKMAALDLRKRPWLNRDVFIRGSFLSEGEEEVKSPQPGDEAGFDVDMFTLVKAFAVACARLPQEELRHEVIMEHVSVTDRIYEILEMFRDRDNIAFGDVFVGLKVPLKLVVSFLAVLEMAKLKLIRIHLGESFDAIVLQRHVDVGEEVIRC